MPASSTQRATPSGPSSIATPSASSTSAEPACDDCGAVAVLHDARARARRDERGHRRHVDRARAVAAGAARVDRAVGDVHRRAEAVHRAHERGELVVGLALRAQRDDERRRPARRRRDLRRSRPSRRRSSSAESSSPRVSRARIGVRISFIGHAQSHQRSWSSTPRAISPSCTCEVPSTIVSCRASR